MPKEFLRVAPVSSVGDKEIPLTCSKVPVVRAVENSIHHDVAKSLEIIPQVPSILKVLLVFLQISAAFPNILYAVDWPPMYTVFVGESELYELFSTYVDRKMSPAALLVHRYMPGW